MFFNFSIKWDFALDSAFPSPRPLRLPCSLDQVQLLKCFLQLSDLRTLPFGQPLIDNGMSTIKRPVYVSAQFSLALIILFKNWAFLNNQTLLVKHLRLSFHAMFNPLAAKQNICRYAEFLSQLYQTMLKKQCVAMQPNSQTFSLSSKFKMLDQQCLIVWPGP